MFIPTNHDCPIPLDFLDTHRYTRTSLDGDSSRIENHWLPDDASCQQDLLEPWTGSTFFQIRPPEPKFGYQYVQGRLTKIQKTERPPTVLPEQWTYMSKKDKALAIKAWKDLHPRIEAAREKRGISEYMPADQLPEYNRVISDAIKSLRPTEDIAPAMAVIQTSS